MTWHPPRSISIPWKALIRRKDPDFDLDRQNEVEYEMSNGRIFRGNPNKRGPYTPED